MIDVDKATAVYGLAGVLNKLEKKFQKKSYRSKKRKNARKCWWLYFTKAPQAPPPTPVAAFPPHAATVSASVIGHRDDC